MTFILSQDLGHASMNIVGASKDVYTPFILAPTSSSSDSGTSFASLGVLAQAQGEDPAVLYSFELLASTDPSKIISDMHAALHLQPSCHVEFLQLVWQHVHQEVGRMGGEVTQPEGAIHESLPAHIQQTVGAFLVQYGDTIWPDPVNELSRRHLKSASKYPMAGYWTAQLGADTIDSPHMSIHGSKNFLAGDYRLVDASVHPNRTSLRLRKVLQLYIAAMLRIPGDMHHGSQASNIDTSHLLQAIVPQQQHQQQDPNYFQLKRCPQAQTLYNHSISTMGKYPAAFQQVQHQPQPSPAMITNPWSPSNLAYGHHQQQFAAPQVPRGAFHIAYPFTHQAKLQPRMMHAHHGTPTIQPAPGGRARRGDTSRGGANRRAGRHRGARGREGRFPLREDGPPGGAAGQAEEGHERGRSIGRAQDVAAERGVEFRAIDWQPKKQ